MTRPALSITADDSSLAVAITYDGNTTTDGNYQGGDDAAAAGSTETTATLTAAQVAAVFSTTNSAAGADGGSTGDPSYSLVFAGDAGDQVNGSWTSDGTDVVWSVASAGTSYAGVLRHRHQVFRIDLNASTGEVTFTQFANLDHTTADSQGSSDDYLTLDAGQLSVQQSITLTDGDGDTDTATDSFDLGGNFRIGDDGPSLSITADDSSLGVATTYDGNTTTDGNYQGGDDAAAAGSTETTATLTAAQVAAVFSTTNSAAGADGGSTGDPSYSLVFAGDAGDQVNGSWTSDGTDVVWSVINAGTSYAGVLDGTSTQVFRIDITAGTGAITFTQFENLDHTSAESTGPYSDDYLTLADGQLSVQQSITLTDGDSDTDTATDSFDLGGNFRIGDDGPSLSITADDSSLGVATTYDGNTTTDGNYQGGDDAAAAGSTETTATLTAAQVAAVFSTTNSAAGADGGSTGTSLVFAGTDGEPVFAGQRWHGLNRSMAPGPAMAPSLIVTPLWSVINAGTSHHSHRWQVSSFDLGGNFQIDDGHTGLPH